MGDYLLSGLVLAVLLVLSICPPGLKFVRALHQFRKATFGARRALALMGVAATGSGAIIREYSQEIKRRQVQEFQDRAEEMERAGGIQKVTISLR